MAFAPWGIKVFGLSKDEKTVSLYNKSGLIKMHPTYGRKKVIFFVKWKCGEQYAIKTEREKKHLKAPSQRPIVSVEISAPLGQKPYKIFLPGGKDKSYIHIPGKEGFYDIGITVRNLVNNKISFSLQGSEYSISQEFEVFFKKLRIHLGKTALIRLSFRKPFKKDIEFHLFLEKKDMKKYIKLASWIIPTNIAGLVEGYRLRDTISIGNPIWDRISAFFTGRRKRDYHDPIAYQTLVIENNLKAPVSLIITSDFLDPLDKKPVIYFYPKDWSATGGTRHVMAFLNIEPKSRGKVVLPIYAGKGLKAGEYLDKITVIPFGSSKFLLSSEKKIRVIKSNPFFTLWMIFILFISLSFFIVFFTNYKRIISSLNTRSLVLISLIGSVGFCIRFAGFIFFSFLYALFGPFNVLFGGFITEILYYITLTVLIYLIPKPGVVTLSGLVSYLMSGITMGSFGLADILFLGSNLTFKEGFLYLLGVTRKEERPSPILLALSLSIADAFIKLSSLVIHSVLFRLFYPLWYIAMVVLITGFAYTFAGVLIGVPFGMNLRKVER